MTLPEELTVPSRAPRTVELDVAPPPSADWEPEEPEPFGLNEVNRRLAALGREPA